MTRFKFNTVGLFTRDNKATVDFYAKAFGFTTDWDGIQPNVEMKLGEMRIILFAEASSKWSHTNSIIPKVSTAQGNWLSTCPPSPMSTRNISMRSIMGQLPSYRPPQNLGDNAPAMWPIPTAT